jgi:hypothetical protein
MVAFPRDECPVGAAVTVRDVEKVKLVRACYALTTDGYSD